MGAAGAVMGLRAPAGVSRGASVRGGAGMGSGVRPVGAAGAPRVALVRQWTAGRGRVSSGPGRQQESRRGLTVVSAGAVAVSAAEVKALRDETGGGMMDCKKALQEAGGDLKRASEILRQKGLVSAGKKAGRAAAEGIIGTYVHGKTGVMIEVNCETDFVSGNDTFKELVKNLAMQVVANPGVDYVREDEIPAEDIEEERRLEMGREDLASKPEEIRAKMVDGRLKKMMAEKCLLNQAYIRDPGMTVEQLVAESVAKIGENIQVRRFSRFIVGEGIEKKVNDLAADIAEMTGAK